MIYAGYFTLGHSANREMSFNTPLILAGDEIFNLGIGEHWSIAAHIEIPDIASSAFTYAALHPLLQGGYHLLRGEAQFFQDREGKPYHNWWSTNNSHCIAG